MVVSHDAILGILAPALFVFLAWIVNKFVDDKIEKRIKTCVDKDSCDKRHSKVDETLKELATTMNKMATSLSSIETVINIYFGLPKNKGIEHEIK